MDELRGITDDANLDAKAPRVARPGEVTPGSGGNDATRSRPADPGSGSLAELESLQGALYSTTPDAEVESLRRSLEVENRLDAQALTREEETRHADTLRHAVTDLALNSAARQSASDPTERYEIHDAAVTGDAIARAIEESTEHDRRADREQVTRIEGERAVDRARAAAAESQRADDARAADTRHASDEARIRQASAARNRDEMRDAKAVRDRASMLAEDRSTQMSGSAAAAHFGSGRPPAPIDDRGTSNEGNDDHVDRVASVFDAGRIETPTERHAGKRGA